MHTIKSLGRSRLAAVALVLLIIIGCVPYTGAQASTSPISVQQGSNSTQAQQLEEFYTEMWQMVGDTYYDRSRLESWGQWKDKYDGQLQTLSDLERALQEMTASLGDRWTHYTTSSEIASMMFEHYAGWQPLGFALAQDAEGSWKIEGLMHGSPAQESDLRHDDTIISIGGTNLATLASAGQIMQLTYARTGTQVEVTYLEHDSGTERQVTLTAREPRELAVEAKRVDGIVYVRLPEFSMQFVVEMLVELSKYQKQSAGIEKLILDLRGNPGGSFDAALLVASIFLDKGNVVSTVTRDQRMTRHTMHEVTEPLSFEYLSMKEEIAALLKLLHRVPLLVLMDRSTASASEVVIGALVENSRATTVGEHSFGKGVGYREFPLATGGMLQVTTLGYVTPSGFDLSGKGLTPQVVVQQPRGASDDVVLDRALELIKQGSGPAEAADAADDSEGKSDSAAPRARDHLDLGCYITLPSGIEIWVPYCE